MSEVQVQDALEDILSRVTFQVYYRQLGAVSVHFGSQAVYEAARYLSTTRMGGSVDWVVEGWVGEWDDLTVVPNFPDTSPRISLWLFGSFPRQRNTVLVRKGWWTLYLPAGVERRVVGVNISRLLLGR